MKVVQAESDIGHFRVCTISRWIYNLTATPVRLCGRMLRDDRHAFTKAGFFTLLQLSNEVVTISDQGDLVIAE